MKTMKTLLVAALAVAGLAVMADAQAARSGWSGSRAGFSGGHWGGYRGWYGPRLGLYLGAPILWSAWYWGGYPYYYPYDYYGPRVIYRDVERYPASYPEGYMEPAPTTEIDPRAQGAPAQAPAYLNYCDSARAYFPKVTSCPEGWRFEPAR